VGGFYKSVGGVRCYATVASELQQYIVSANKPLNLYANALSYRALDPEYAAQLMWSLV